MSANTLYVLLTMGVQLEYINHMLQFLKNISYYAGIMLNAFSDLFCSKLCWHNWLVPNAGSYVHLYMVVVQKVHSMTNYC